MSPPLKHGCPAISVLSVMKQRLVKAVCFPTENLVDLCREKEMWLQCDAGLAVPPGPVSPSLPILLVQLSCCDA